LVGTRRLLLENDPNRALLFAEHCTHRKNSRIRHPAVIGAVIDLGYCLNLIESENLQLLKAGYETLVSASETYQTRLPRNSGNLLLRHLDCAVLETVHSLQEQSQAKSFDSVRGVFWEGTDLYPNAGFKEKNHIQICVRNPNCIKGLFRVRRPNRRYTLP
jgi:hypothetical protein